MTWLCWMTAQPCLGNLYSLHQGGSAVITSFECWNRDNWLIALENQPDFIHRPDVGTSSAEPCLVSFLCTPLSSYERAVIKE